MTKCKYCGASGVFLKLDKNKMCNNCKDFYLIEINNLQEKINNYYCKMLSYDKFTNFEKNVYDGIEVLLKLKDYINKGYSANLMIQYDVAKSLFYGNLDLIKRLYNALNYPSEINFKFVESHEWVLEQRFNQSIIKDVKNFFTPLRREKEYEDHYINLDKHFLYQLAIIEIIKEKDLYPLALTHFIILCKKDIDLFVKNPRLFPDENVYSFYNLSNYYEQIKEYEEELNIINIAIECKISFRNSKEYYINKKNKILKLIKNY